MDTQGNVGIKNGTIALFNGKVIVTDPEPEGKLAIIVPGEHVQVFVNDNLIKIAQEVKNSDNITVTPCTTKASWKMESRVSPDGMVAFVRFQKNEGEVYQLADEPASEKLVINGVLAELCPPQIGVEEVIQILHARKIVFGIMPEMIQLAIDAIGGEEFIVAKGLAPQPGVDGYIQPLFGKKEGLGEDEETSLIHKHEVISVEANDLLAKVIPPQPGKTGTDVYGKAVPPAPLKKIKLVAGSGARLNEDGTSALALISGRPVLKGSVVAVYPSYTIMGDIDAKTGQINFKGDVIIKGNVLDGLKIEASGKVTVLGYVANSTILAGGDIVIQNNLVGGIARAGGAAAICQRIIANLNSLATNLKHLVPAINQLKKHPSVARNKDLQRIGDGVLIKMLFDTKFSQIPTLFATINEDLSQLTGFFESAELDSFKEKFEKSQARLCARVPIELNTMPKITEFINHFVGEINTIKGLVRTQTDEQAKLSVLYVQNSVVESSGDVDVTGKGCYNSNIYAGGNVSIYGSPGVFRSGEIVSGGNVKVRELGSVAEAITSVELQKNKLLIADKVYPGVAIKAGVRVERITSTTHGLKFSS